MREIRKSGSEGGGAKQIVSSYPYFIDGRQQENGRNSVERDNLAAADISLLKEPTQWAGCWLFINIRSLREALSSYDHRITPLLTLIS